MTISIMQNLRTATRPFHESIESGLRLMDKNFTAADYIHYLSKSYGYYAPLEQGIAKTLASSHGWPLAVPDKTSLIKKDLMAMGYTLTGIDNIPHCLRLPPVHDVAQASGILYVLEGATLGSQIIARHLKKLLNLYDAQCHFIQAYGKETASRWKAFGQSMESLISPNMEQAVIASACATFQTMQQWLTGK